MIRALLITFDDPDPNLPNADTFFQSEFLKFPNPRSSRKGESLTRPYKLRYLVHFYGKKNTLQKDKTASRAVILLFGRRSQHLVNIVNSLQIYMSKSTLFCRNRSLPASFGALLNECFLISFGKTFLFVTNCREFMINFMCFFFFLRGGLENSFSLFCPPVSLASTHFLFVSFFAVLLHFIIHKEPVMDKHMQTSYIL